MRPAVEIIIISHDFPYRVDRIDLGATGARHVNRREVAVVQDKAVHIEIFVEVHSYDRTGVVDSFSDRYIRAGHVEPGEVAVAAPPEAVARRVLGFVATLTHLAVSHIISHHITGVVDPEGHGPKKGVIIGHIECGGEPAVAPDEAVTFLVCIPVGPHDLALRVDEAALRSDRTGRDERYEIAVLIEKGVRRPPSVKVSSASWPDELIPLMAVNPAAAGSLIVVKPSLFNTKPCVPSASSNCPAIASVGPDVAELDFALQNSGDQQRDAS